MFPGDGASGASDGISIMRNKSNNQAPQTSRTWKLVSTILAAAAAGLASAGV